MQLDNHQQAVVDFTPQPSTMINVKATPGSGKSTVFAHKVADLLGKGVKPEEIIVITFTNKSARDIKAKIKKLIGKTRNDAVPHVSTIHSLFIKLLKDADAKPIILSEWNNLLTLRSIIEQHFQFDTKRELTGFTQEILTYIDFFQLSMPEESIDNLKILEYKEAVLSNTQFQKIYKEYDALKRERNLWSYNDLISARIKEHINIEEINTTVNYMFNDEAHDETLSELLLIRDIAKGKTLYNVFDQCLAGDSLIKIKHNGEVRTERIDELCKYENGSIEVESLDGWVIMKKWMDKGVKETIELEFEDGRTLRCTPDHKIETSNRGWVEAQDLTEEDDVLHI